MLAFEMHRVRDGQRSLGDGMKKCCSHHPRNWVIRLIRNFLSSFRPGLCIGSPSPPSASYPLRPFCSAKPSVSIRSAECNLTHFRLFSYVFASFGEILWSPIMEFYGHLSGILLGPIWNFIGAYAPRNPAWLSHFRPS